MDDLEGFEQRGDDVVELGLVRLPANLVEPVEQRAPILVLEDAVGGAVGLENAGDCNDRLVAETGERARLVDEAIARPFEGRVARRHRHDGHGLRIAIGVCARKMLFYREHLVEAAMQAAISDGETARTDDLLDQVMVDERAGRQRVQDLLGDRLSPCPI